MSSVVRNDEKTSTHEEATGEKDDEDGRSIQDDEEETRQDDQEPPSSPAEPTTSTSLLVSAEDIAPVSGLSGIDLPLQLAAEYTKFGHRGVRRGYAGDLRSIVLTWPSRLGATESILPGDMVWCYGKHGLDGHIGLVKVVSLGDTLDEVMVEDANGIVTSVQMHQVRRLKEYLIRKGKIQLRGIQ
ncbi:unnamed protein product [Phytophthora fragariaefolia]|uniref:Unnamed protein product n=1 Tax=Phytophthora fragariaefolia TaxID=1490495 RepID=A0A9W6XMT0_9STRA|nr:unnamed protein product [Phytophthora fragariaefolia]